MEGRGREPLWFLWGKWGSGDESAREPRGFHPLICHMLDVSQVALAMWDEVLAPAARRHLAGGLGLSEIHARAWIAFLAAGHDLGKASPAFQGKVKDPRIRQLLRRAGLGIPQSAPHPPPVFHGEISAMALRRLLPREFGVPEHVGLNLAVLLGGHHGIFPDARKYEERTIGSAAGDAGWAAIRLDILRRLAQATGIDRAQAPTLYDHGIGMLLAGMVSVADWIGSNTDFFPTAVSEAEDPRFPEMEAYVQDAAEKARRALASLLWGAPPLGEGPDFEALFPFEPNALQNEAIGLAGRLDSPGLVVIEAPMGEGKTEAALFLGDRWMSRCGQRGAYLALPTQATSNQLFTRTARFLTRRYPSTPVQLQLQHGHASLHEEFELLLEKGRRAFLSSGVDIDGDADACDGGISVMAADWFTHRKRGLLSPFGVGTLDQALLAVLRTRHVFVRLFGLAHKVVIIDEVHAYDTYMTTLLERLLGWLSAIGTTVIVLSATLPRARREALLRAYRGDDRPVPDGERHRCGAQAPGPRGEDERIPDVKYPRLTWISATCTGARTFATSVRAGPPLSLRTFDASSAPDGSPARLSEEIAAALSGGGCVAVICNTVSRAQAMYSALQPFFPGTATDGGPELDLLHARYPFGERQEREKRCLERFGKPLDDGTSPHRPARAVLVATQIVEQSLDLDFDLMVTDMAPIDLLLQRSGRLHRHKRPGRPVDLENPCLWLVGPEAVTDDVPIFDSGTAHVYDGHVLLRTWIALQGRSAIRIPSEVEELIEQVYDQDSLPPEAAGEVLKMAWAQTQDKARSRLFKEKEEAMKRWVHAPDHEIPLSELTADAQHEDSPGLHQEFQALTRLAPPSITVVCLYEQEGAYRLPDGKALELSRKPSLALTRRLIERSVTVSTKGLVQALEAKQVPPGWRRSPLLRHCRLLGLDEAGRREVGEYRVLLDSQLGLVIEKS